jgi:hypothetical protein
VPRHKRASGGLLNFQVAKRTVERPKSDCAGYCNTKFAG